MDSSPRPSAEDVARFRDALRQAAESAQRFALAGATTRQMGMLVDGLLLRCRELNVRWRSLSPMAVEPAAPPAAPATHAGELPVWNLPSGPVLHDRVSEMLAGAPLAAEQEAWPSCAAAFQAHVWPALDGPHGLLRLLPRVQEEITRCIYREDFFRG